MQQYIKAEIGKCVCKNCGGCCRIAGKEFWKNSSIVEQLGELKRNNIEHPCCEMLNENNECEIWSNFCKK